MGSRLSWSEWPRKINMLELWELDVNRKRLEPVGSLRWDGGLGKKVMDAPCCHTPQPQTDFESLRAPTPPTGENEWSSLGIQDPWRRQDAVLVNGNWRRRRKNWL